MKAQWIDKTRNIKHIYEFGLLVHISAARANCKFSNVDIGLKIIVFEYYGSHNMDEWTIVLKQIAKFSL